MANEPSHDTSDAYDDGRRRIVPDSILHSGLSRRGMLKALGMLGGIVVVGGGAAACTPDQTPSDYVLPEGFSGTIADLKHVVILIQENRSFDQYYGALPGVRGFDDKQALRYQDGTTVFQQPHGSSTLSPQHQSTVSGMSIGNDHGYGTGISAWNNGLYNNWVGAKGTNTMIYMTGEELPYQYSLATAYTICDQNYCSVAGPTTPNRLYQWTGSSNGVTDNGTESNGLRAWETYPEKLQAAGVTWRNYVDNTNNGSSWCGDYTDNPIRGFATFTTSGNTATDLANRNDPAKNAAGTGLVWRAASEPYQAHGLPNNDSDENLNGVLEDFIAACKPGAEFPLPEVSWIVAPYLWSEHPAADPEHGAHYTNRVLTALQGNPEIWNHTLVILAFDENDGTFDHALPPRPEPGTKDEFSSGGKLNLAGTPIGYGPRTPLVLVSPWTRGGFVSSEVFDHTSIIRFLEVWTESLGKPAKSTMITDWRRAISGDLTSAIDFEHPVLDTPSLPDTYALIEIANNAPSADFGKTYTGEKWKLDRPLIHRPLSYHPHGTFVEDRVNGTVTAKLSMVGGPAGKAVSLQAFPDAYAPASNTPHTVTAAQPAEYSWDAKRYDGRYAFSVYGPDGFVRSHAGTVLPAGQNNAGVPRLDVRLIAGTKPTVSIELHNDGRETVEYTLVAHEYDGGTQTVHVESGASKTVNWPTSEGYYDVVITADTGTGWQHRYAGRIAQIKA
ncbi:phospholipase C, phosphocholine-specific [Dactylosporangium salmoneum]|uniref:phospholipase C n=2 Tax=Dactylosporangium salmoneum TaxID=53361 RepID=A0ABP5SJM0_9ACTN